ncbi:MAG: DNA polymerase III subunit beta [Candidatus Kaiserbacteria bacterium]|nr:DNA polymerase III subunit beta [Candidatus Kaiserbacteria bacterium]
MKFTAQTDVLKSITGIFTKAADKTALSETSGIYIEVSGTTVSFKMHQFDFFISYTIEGTDCSDGTIFVAPQALDTVIVPIIDALTTIELSGSKLLVRTKSSESDLFTLSLEDRNVFLVDTASIADKKPTVSLQREVVIRGFKDVQHAAAESVVKPEIASVYLYTKGETVYFAATDGFRLAETRFLAENVDADVGIIIPIKNVQKIVRILENSADTDVHLFVEGDTVHLRTETVYIRTSSVQGTFPNYAAIIPASFAAEITVIKKDILNFLKKARLFSNKLNRLSFGVHDEKNIFLSFSNETAGSTKNIIAASVKGQVTAFPSFNYLFVSDALSVIPDDRVVLKLVDDSTKPLTICGATDTSLITIVSPLLEE